MYICVYMASYVSKSSYPRFPTLSPHNLMGTRFLRYFEHIPVQYRKAQDATQHDWCTAVQSNLCPSFRTMHAPAPDLGPTNVPCTGSVAPAIPS